jgi:hypothetical protein
MADFFTRAERSWQLVQASWNVLRSDRELLVLPAISGVTAIALGVGFLALAMGAGTFERMQDGQAGHIAVSLYAAIFIWYIIQYFIIFFFNTALVAAALARLNGADPTLKEALALAASRSGQIFGYAVISATVGILLHAFSERLGLIGRIMESVIGVAWTAATFLVVPVLVVENVGPMEAIRRSASLLRRSWGENLIGNGGISFAIGCACGFFGIVGIGGGTLAMQSGDTALSISLYAVAFAGILATLLVGSALSAVYTAALYCYAALDETPAGFDKSFIRGAFIRRDRI